MKKEKYNDIMYHLSQGCLKLIFNQLLAISFKYMDDDKLSILICLMENLTDIEKEVLLELQDSIKMQLTNYTIEFEFKHISEEEFLNYSYKSLEHVFFLRSQEDFI